MEVVVPAAREEERVSGARGEPGSGPALELGQAPRVVLMGVVVEENLDVRELESELLDVGLDLRRRLGEPPSRRMCPWGVAIRNEVTSLAPT